VPPKKAVSRPPVGDSNTVAAWHERKFGGLRKTNSSSTTPGCAAAGWTAARCRGAAEAAKIQQMERSVLRVPFIDRDLLIPDGKFDSVIPRQPDPSQP
jgi:hypothetical protein